MAPHVLQLQILRTMQYDYSLDADIPQTRVGALAATMPGRVRPNLGGDGGSPRAIRCALVS